MGPKDPIEKEQINEFFTNVSVDVWFYSLRLKWVLVFTIALSATRGLVNRISFHMIRNYEKVLYGSTQNGVDISYHSIIRFVFFSIFPFFVSFENKLQSF